jgi:hypothetical protein
MNNIKERDIQLFLLILIIILITSLVYYIYDQVSKNTTNNKIMKTDLSKINKNLHSMNPNDAIHNHKLRDYYIMSSYNSCCNGDFKNSYVSLDSLKEVIGRGARLLDFEVYSINKKTVISASSNNSFHIKGMYNSLDFSEVMNVVKNYAYSSSTSPTFKDPLFLHFRIKTNETHVCNDMAKVISEVFSNTRLSGKYNFESNGENIGAEPIHNFLGKTVVICDKSNPIFEGTQLDELTNFTSGSVFLQKLRNYDVLYNPNGNTLINNNKKNMSITMPDLMINDDNIDASIHIKYGCQFICMNFQSVDNNLIYYLEQFNSAQSAFILKPEELRYKQVYAKKPVAQNKKLSFEPRLIKKPYFSHKL